MLLLSLLVLSGFVPAPHDCAPVFVPSENNSNHEEVALVRRRSFQPLFIGGLLAGLGGGGAPAPPPPPAQAPAGQTVPGGKGAKAADTAVTAIGASENIMSSVFDAMNPMNMIRPWMKVASTVANGAGAVTDKVITNHVDPNKEPQQTQSQPQPQPQPHLDSEELPEEEIEEAFDDEYEDDSTYEDDTMYEEEMNYPSAEPNTALAQQDFVNNPTSLNNLNKADTANDNSPTGNLSKQSLILIIVGSICFTVLIVAIIVGCIIGNKVKSNSTGNEKNIFEIITSNAGPGDFSYMNLNNPIAATTTFNANDLSNTYKPPIMANDL